MDIKKLCRITDSAEPIGKTLLRQIESFIGRGDLWKEIKKSLKEDRLDEVQSSIRSYYRSKSKSIPEGIETSLSMLKSDKSKAIKVRNDKVTDSGDSVKAIGTNAVRKALTKKELEVIYDYSSFNEVIFLKDNNLAPLAALADKYLFDAWEDKVIGVLPDGQIVEVIGYRDPYSEDWATVPTFGDWEDIGSIIADETPDSDEEGDDLNKNLAIEKAKEGRPTKLKNYPISDGVNKLKAWCKENS